ncbi:putative peroxisomal membrane protein [Clavispora lusitaniae]|uniref:Peroxisomal membrane protein n=1 Tax=Clavispora lusitaniae TaxID=36911 RepID=A0AA91PWB0_CLALS|nr:putative peroxisomal membrane protein [Clavispora lusitaniae]
MMSSLYSYSSGVADSRPGSARGIAAGTAASLLGMGIEHLDRNSEDSLRLTDEELDPALSSGESHGRSKDHRTKEEKEQGHFMDRFMERLLRHTIAEDSAESEQLSSRINDPSRSGKPQLSFRIFASNMKQLSAQMGTFFRLQYGLIHVLTWRKPTKTLTCLVVYTAVCCWPHLVVAFPLLFLLFGVIIPAHLYRHPFQRPEILPVKKRGESFLDFLNKSDDHSVVLDLLNEPKEGFSDTQSINSSSTSVSYASTPLTLSSASEKTTPEELRKKDKSKYVKSQVSMLMNMRDLQNLTTDILEAMEQAKQLSTNIVGFKDERLTTFVFYVTIAVTSVVLLLGKYIPWRAIFIFSGWAGLILCHPNTKKYLVGFGNAKSSKATEKKEPKQLFLDTFDSRSIIVDDEPEVRVVEIYELQARNILRRKWKPHAYSKRLFDWKDPVRVAGKRPHGVDNLSKVLPPPEWKYDFGYANNWHIDIEPQNFLWQRGIDMQHLECPSDETEGWIYDKLPADDDISTEFRRRRLFRECFRYARPVPRFSVGT